MLCRDAGLCSAGAHVVVAACPDQVGELLVFWVVGDLVAEKSKDWSPAGPRDSYRRVKVYPLCTPVGAAKAYLPGNETAPSAKVDSGLSTSLLPENFIKEKITVNNISNLKLSPFEGEKSPGVTKRD